MPKKYDLFYKLRGTLMAPPYLVLVYGFLAQDGGTVPLWIGGMTVFTLGLLLRFWAQLHIHYRLRIRKTLTRSGPYSMVRNPIYIGNTCMLLGLTVVSGMLWFVPVMAVWCMAVYALVVRREEAHLLEKYGEPYADFLQTVPRWIPRMDLTVPRPRSLRSLLLPSLTAEVHCLLWLVPFAAIEILTLIR